MNNSNDKNLNEETGPNIPDFMDSQKIKEKNGPHVPEFLSGYVRESQESNRSQNHDTSRYQPQSPLNEHSGNASRSGSSRRTRKPTIKGPETSKGKRYKATGKQPNFLARRIVTSVAALAIVAGGIVGVNAIKNHHESNFPNYSYGTTLDDSSPETNDAVSTLHNAITLETAQIAHQQKADSRIDRDNYYPWSFNPINEDGFAQVLYKSNNPQDSSMEIAAVKIPEELNHLMGDYIRLRDLSKIQNPSITEKFELNKTLKNTTDSVINYANKTHSQTLNTMILSQESKDWDQTIQNYNTINGKNLPTRDEEGR